MANATEDGLSFEALQAVTCRSSPHERYFIYLLTSVNILLAITASLGNALILAALQKETSIFPPTKFLFQCLAVSDFCVGVFAQPLFVIQLISTAHEQAKLCYTVVSIIDIAGGSFIGVSLLTVTAISVDRLLAISLGMRYRYVITLKRIRAILICGWIFIFSFSLFRFFWNYALISTIISVAIFSALTISAFCYLKIFLILRQHYATQGIALQGQSHRGRISPLNIARFRKTVSTALCVQLTMVACYLPYGIISSIQYEKGYSPTLNLAALLAATLGAVSSSLNPILYCWRIDSIRHAVKDILQQLYQLFL